eukprot:10154_5
MSMALLSASGIEWLHRWLLESSIKIFSILASICRTLKQLLRCRPARGTLPESLQVVTKLPPFLPGKLAHLCLRTHLCGKSLV